MSKDSKMREAEANLKEALSALKAALSAWDSSVSKLWRTSLVLTQAQKKVMHAHDLLRKERRR